MLVSTVMLECGKHSFACNVSDACIAGKYSNAGIVGNARVGKMG